MPKQASEKLNSVDVVKTSMSVISLRANKLLESVCIVQLHGKPLQLVNTDGFEHFERLTKDRFESLFYRLFGGISRAAVNDVFNYTARIAPDVSEYDYLFMLGSKMWDSRKLSFVEGVDPKNIVWRSPISPAEVSGRVDFLLAAAKGDVGVYEDMLQSMAPILMEKKPDGVFWWVGDGANGKSSLIDTLYRIFPGQLCSLTVKGINDGRDTPMLNGFLANVVKESSEGRVDDTQVYKSIGTHEEFSAYKFRNQEGVTIRGNMHHIFSANQTPVITDKGFSARSRTLIIPFKARFESDPTFNDRTFTPKVLGQLLAEILRVTKEIKHRQYRYKFSQITENGKTDYDSETNNAEDYTRSILADGIVAFDNFISVRSDYERWCAEQGYVPEGIGYMRRVIQEAGFDRRSTRNDYGINVKRYMLKTVSPSDLVELGLNRRGLYTAYGFTPPEEKPKRPKEGVYEGLEGW